VTSHTKKFLSPEQLAQALTEVAEIAQRENVYPVLIGGFAMQLYGSDRLACGLELAASDTVKQLPTEKILSCGGQRTTSPSGVPVDIVVRNDEMADLYSYAIYGALRIDGIPVPVVTPDYLASIKFGSRNDRDTADVEFLVLSNRLNLDRVREVIRTHMGWYAARKFGQLIDEAHRKAELDLR
jgi:hypothetical protein